MGIKYEFDSWDEVLEAMNNLSEYHDCDKCHGKIVGIRVDKLGNEHCGYCGERVNYPKLSKKGFELEKKKWEDEVSPKP